MLAFRDQLAAFQRLPLCPGGEAWLRDIRDLQSTAFGLAAGFPLTAGPGPDVLQAGADQCFSRRREETEATQPAPGFGGQARQEDVS